MTAASWALFIWALDMPFRLFIWEN
jgi:hypothetical protein